jgi:hypothetical protein
MEMMERKSFLLYSLSEKKIQHLFFYTIRHFKWEISIVRLIVGHKLNFSSGELDEMALTRTREYT